MLIHVNDAVTLQGARALRQPLIIPYGIHQEYELQIVTGHDNAPVDVESRGCVKWTLTITPSPENPTKVLAYAVFAENIATGSYLRFDLAATSVEMYKHVAGNPATPAVLQLQGFTEEDAPATLVITFPVALVTTAQQRLPVDLSTALMQELQLAVSVVGAAQREISKYAGDTTDAAERAEQAAINARASEVNAEHSATAAGVSAGNTRESELAAETAQEKAETAQGKAEDAQTAAETAQGKAEDAQSAAETAQDAAETAQDKAEDAQDAAEAAQTAAETAQGKAETAQGKAEDAQTAAEAAQTAAETAQGKAEDAQTAAETAQGKAEDAQTAAETAQGKAEDAQQAAETAQGAAETAQGKAEDAQQAAETAQGKAEDAQTAAEAAQQAAETAQGKAEDAQDAAEAAQTASETAQGKAEAAQTAAETAQGKAEAAQTAAETAQSKAETAQGKAEDAQTAAETAQGKAETAQGKAEDAQTAAETAQGKAEDAQAAAEDSEDAAAASAKLSESWAKGDTGVRDDEDTNNAKYYAELSEHFSPVAKADKVTGGDTDGMVAGLDSEGNLTNTGIPADNVAQKDGYYEDMTVGRAENLIDPQAPATRRKFGFDTACGDISITDNGNAIIKVMYGTTYVMNQLVPDEEGEYDIHIDRDRKYLYRRSDGTESILTGTSTFNMQHVIGGSEKLINLTVWFAPGYEPTIDGFYRMFPYLKGYDIPYNAGSFFNCMLTGVKTVGFNAYNHATGTAMLLGGNKYQICGTYESVSYADVSGEAETLELDEHGIFTPKYNGTLTVAGGNGTDTCVHLVWSGYKNYGEPDYKWEPYTEHVKELPVLEYFPDGMNGVKTVHDELTGTSCIKRFGVVNLDDFTWRLDDASQYGLWTSVETINGKGNENIMWTRGRGSLGSAVHNSEMYINRIAIWVDHLRCNCGSAVNHPTGYMVYELKTPVVTTFDQPLNLTYPVNDFGTEQSLPINTTTLVSTDLDADIQYSIDFTRTVQHYSEIEKDVEGLVAEKDNLARQDGYYARQGLGAATAENLVDPNAPGTERSFVSDTSCGTASIADNGRAIVEKFTGRTLVWNQRITGTTGWGGAGTGNTTRIDAENHTVIYDCRNAGVPYYLYYPKYQSTQWQNSHVYYVTLWTRWEGVSADSQLVYIGASLFTSGAANQLDIENASFGPPASFRSYRDWRRVGIIAATTSTVQTNGNTSFMVQGSPKGILYFRDMMIFDLTQMFGKGREPTTIAAFRALFPDPWYDYSPNTFLNYKGTGIRTVGFNQYSPSNEYIRVRPQPYQITGTYTAMNYSQWPLYVQPTALTLNQATTATTLYSYQNTWYTANGSIEAYDATRTYKVGEVCIHENAWMTSLVDITTAEEWDSTHWEATGESTLQNTRYFHSHAMTPDSDGVFTPPDYGWLYVLGGNSTDTCVHFTWSGYRNGEYEPYWENTKELPVTEQFTDGMDGIAGVSGDELYADKKVQKWATYVFKGTENWQTAPGWNTSGFPTTFCACADYNSVSPSKKKGTRNLLCNKLMTQTAGLWGALGDVDGICGYDDARNYSVFIRIKLTTIGATSSDTLEVKLSKFRAWLAAQYEAGTPMEIVYERATPVETPIDPPQEVAYPVADFGLEESVPVPTGSMGLNAVVKYSTDYTRELTHMIDENVRGRVDALDEEIEKKANKDGDYRREGLIANAAGNLVDEHAQSVPGVFTFRTTAGDESVAAQGVAQIESVKGTTHSYNQMAEDYHDNTVQGFGSVTVQDAKGGSPLSNVFQGETIVSSQLVPASQETTASGEGMVEVSTAKAGDAHSLVMTAPRSVVVNQLVQNGNFADGATGWNPQNITLSTADNVLSLTYGLTGNRNIRKDISFVVGHTYMVTSETKDEVDGAFAFLFQLTGGSVSAYVTPSNAWKRNTVKFTAAADSGACYWMLYNGVLEAEVTSQMRNVQLVDLTQYFNGYQTLIDSITSWDDLVAYDPRFASYVAYNTGTVEGVTPSVKVSGRNLLNLASTDEYSINKSNPDAPMPVLRDGLVIKGFNSQTYIYPNTIASYASSNGVLTVTTSEATNSASYGIGYVVKCAPNRAYVFSVEEFETSAVMDLTWLDTDGYRISYHSNFLYAGLAPKTMTSPANAAWMILGFRNNVVNSTKTYTKPMVCVADAQPSSYEPYFNGGTAQAPELFAVGNASDEFEAVSGTTTRKMASVDLGTLNWGAYNSDGGASYPYGSTYNSALTNRAAGRNMVCASYVVRGAATMDMSIFALSSGTAFWLINSAFTGMTGAQIKEALSGVYLYYELAEPTTYTSTPTPISLQDGQNLALQTDGGRNASLTLGYDTTSFSIALESTHSYYTKLSGAESIQTGLSTLAVDATQDKVMDLTRAFTHDMPSTVDQLKTRYPGVASLGAYDRGSFVHLTGGTWTTGVWNQLVNAANAISSNLSSTQASITNDTANRSATLTAVNANVGNGFSIPTTLTAGHKYLVRTLVTESSVPATFRISYSSVSNVVDIDIAGTPETEVAGIIEMTTSPNYIVLYANVQSPYMPVGESCTIRDTMIIDLTVLCGAGNEPSTVEEVRAYCASIGHDLSTFQTYEVGTPVSGSVDLTGIELKGIDTTYRDTYSSEDGAYKSQIFACPAPSGSLSTWVVYHNTNMYGFQVNALPVGGYSYGGYLTTSDVIPSNPEGKTDGAIPVQLLCGASNATLTIRWNSTQQNITDYIPEEWLINGDPAQPNLDGFKAWLVANPFDVCYRRQTSTTTTILQQPITLNPGFNDFRQSSAGTLQAKVKMDYAGTSWTLKLVKNRRYLFRHEGQYSMLTPTADTTIDVVSGDKLVDLTRWGGTNALIPAQLDDIYRLYPEFAGELPYSEGELVTFRGTAIETVGFNQWDGSVAATGKLLTVTGAETTDSRFSYTDYVRVVGGLEYEISRVRGTNSAICWYDVNKTFISGNEYLGNSTTTKAFQATAPAMACYARFSLYNSEIPNTVFHLCWSGYRNYGTPGYSYEPYRKSVRELPVSEYFPDGMASDPVSGRYDELRKDKAIQRIYRKVFDGTETWSGPQNSNGNRYFTIASATIGAQSGTYARLPGSNNQFMVQCNFVPNYGVVFNAQIAQSTGTVYWAGTLATHVLYLMLPYNLYNTVTTAAQMKQFCKDMYDAGTPLIVQWPLATPIETPIEEELNLSYNYEDFGTEELLPVNGPVPTTTPASLQIVYQQDFTRDIVNLPKNYQSQESMGELTAVLQTLLNVNILSTWDASNNLYTYAVTGDGVPGLIAAALVALAPVTGITFGVQNYLPTDGVVSIPDPTVLPITTIPDDTTTYTLAEAVYQHTPASVPTYTLPTVTDDTVVHKAVVTVKMSSSVLTANFRNSQGTGITVVGPEGTVRSGTLVEYTAVYEPVARDWAVTARVVTQTEPPPDEIWYTAPAQVTLYSSTGVSRHTFENGRGVVKYTSDVTALRETFRARTSITSIVLPSCVTKINEGACYQCTGLKHINIPDGVMYIGTTAFYQCGVLELASLPDTITTLKNQCFDYCYKVTFGRLPSSLSQIEAYALRKTAVTLNEFPSSVTSIPAYCLFQCEKVTSMRIHVGITSIGSSAFTYCTYLEDVVFDGVPTSVGSTFGSTTRLTSIKVPWDSGEISGAPWGASNATITYGYVPPNVIGYWASDKVTLYSGTGVVKHDFANGYGRVEFSADVTTVGETFRGTAVTRLVFPAGCTGISANAFAGCTSLATVRIPWQAATVGDNAFQGCTSLTDAAFMGTPTSVSATVFDGCTALETIHVPWLENELTNAPWGAPGTTEIEYDFVPYDCMKYTAESQVTLYSSSRVISHEFSNGRGLIRYNTTRTVVPDTLRGTPVQTVKIQDRITSIAGSAFTSCTSLTSINLHDGITSIGTYAFQRCYALLLTKLPANLTQLTNEAFSGCKAMTITEIPATVTYLGLSPLASCTGLTEITFKGTPTSIYNNAVFYGCTNLTTIRVPWSSTDTINANAPWGATNATITYNYTE